MASTAGPPILPPDIYSIRQEILTSDGRWELRLHLNGEWDYTYYPLQGYPHELARGRISSGHVSTDFDHRGAYPPPAEALQSLRLLVERMSLKQGA
jgi:hypothetical protein